MNVNDLEKYVENYLYELKRSKELKDVGQIYFRFKRSKKSQTLYIYFYVEMGFKQFRKTVRISDHNFFAPGACKNKYQGVIVGDNNNINPKEIKNIKRMIRREIKKLLYHARTNTIYNFKAEDY